MNWKTFLMPHMRVDANSNQTRKMNMVVLKMVTGYAIVFAGWMYNQVSDLQNGIIDRGFDAGLSIGLLIVGLIVLGWYHYKYQQYSRQVIAKLSAGKDEVAKEKDKDNKDLTNDIHELAKQQIELSKDQIHTNKEIRDALKNLSDKIKNL